EDAALRVHVPGIFVVTAHTAGVAIACAGHFRFHHWAGLPIPGAAEIEKEDVGQADAGGVGDGRFDITVPLFAVDILDAGGCLLAVDGGAEAAEVLEEEFAAFGVAAEAEVLARDVGEGVELEVGPIIAAAAADHDLLFGHLVRLADAPIIEFNDSERTGSSA